MLGDVPDVFVGSHPVAAIEAGEVHRPGIAAERAFAAEIEIDVEITQCQLTECPIHRLAITAADKV
jgi:hypothetical protein